MNFFIEFLNENNQKYTNLGMEWVIHEYQCVIFFKVPHLVYETSFFCKKVSHFIFDWRIFFANIDIKNSFLNTNKKNTNDNSKANCKNYIQFIKINYSIIWNHWENVLPSSAN